MASDDSDDDRTAAPAAAADQTVKDMPEAELLASLERWFGLPSFQELAEKGKPAEEDPEHAEFLERREKALAAVDPAFIEAHRRRVESGESILPVRAEIELRVDVSFGSLDHALYERSTIAEPREIEVPEPLREDLSEVSPQAILRDLYRPELQFDKVFEIVDMAAEQRLDIVAAVAEAMSTNWKLAAFDVLATAEARAVYTALRREQRGSIAHLLQGLPNRTVTE